MAASKVKVAVELDGGAVLDVVVDQRDFARAEAMELDPSTMKHTWVRYLAFCALKRTGQYDGTWERFNEIDCVEASDRKAPDVVMSDPGRPGRGAGS